MIYEWIFTVLLLVIFPVWMLYGLYRVRRDYEHCREFVAMWEAASERVRQQRRQNQ